mmetsp:Transcript_877/g.3257  ORF Transcript_877/g.3257 Transcript_877/m.3257 type:complete len:574 (-) Transcript_877:159-1880(-)
MTSVGVTRATFAQGMRFVAWLCSALALAHSVWGEDVRSQHLSLSLPPEEAKRIKAIMLTYDRHQQIAFHTVARYNYIWPDHPFHFLIPHQKPIISSVQKVADELGHLSFVEAQHDPRDVNTTILKSLRYVDEDDWVLWCMDDYYPEHADVEALRTLLAHIQEHHTLLGYGADAVDFQGVTPSGFNRMVAARGASTQRREFEPGFELVQNYEMRTNRFWPHHLTKKKVLESFFGDAWKPVNGIMHLMDHTAKNWLPWTADEHDWWAPFDRTLMTFGECTRRGELTHNCAVSFATLGLALPYDFVASSTTMMRGVHGVKESTEEHEKSSDSGTDMAADAGAGENADAGTDSDVVVGADVGMAADSDAGENADAGTDAAGGMAAADSEAPVKVKLSKTEKLVAAYRFDFIKRYMHELNEWKDVLVTRLIEELRLRSREAAGAAACGDKLSESGWEDLREVWHYELLKSGRIAHPPRTIHDDYAEQLVAFVRDIRGEVARGLRALAEPELGTCVAGFGEAYAEAERAWRERVDPLPQIPSAEGTRPPSRAKMKQAVLDDIFRNVTHATLLDILTSDE